MAEAECTDCGHIWETDRPADELNARPHCPACNSGAVNVETTGGWFMVWR